MMHVAVNLASLLTIQISPSAVEVADARCAAALNILIDDAFKNSKKDQPKMVISSAYYLGRLSTRNDAPTFASVIRDVERQLDLKKSKIVGKKCMDDVVAFARAGRAAR